MISIRHNFVKLNDKKKDEIVFFFKLKIIIMTTNG